MPEVIPLPEVCLNMIVRNEAHIVHEVLEAVAPYISTWVIVDTGSDDGTPEVIRDRMERLGIPGELHERPWRNFGANRSEALSLAQGHGDYIWVMDADDIVVGTPDFANLGADVYTLRYGTDFSYWRRQLFRDGQPWRYEGVVHEYAVSDDEPIDEQRLAGDYHIESRRLGGRNLDPRKYERDRDLLLAEVERDPGDSRSVFYLAQSCFDLGEFANARDWYRRRAEMGGWEEEVFYALYRVGESMAALGAPWPEVLDAYLRSWEYRPVRAEPLHAIARAYRIAGRYALGHLFAQRAADIPRPDDALFVGADVYAWRALDEQAICAYWIGNHMESFALCRGLLAGSSLPADERERVAENRDYSVPALIELASVYPAEIVGPLRRGPAVANVTATIVAGADATVSARLINSFLRMCGDVAGIGRFVVLDVGLGAVDRAHLEERYPFLEMLTVDGVHTEAAILAAARAAATGPYWLHLGRDWRFFAPERLLARCLAILSTDAQIAQIGVNVNDASVLAGRRNPRGTEYRSVATGRYRVDDGARVSGGPAFVRADLLDRVGGVDAASADPLGDLGRRFRAAGMRTATLDEVLCTRP
jgi:glycosyltransferase involved in cell wall biosynthesis